MKIAGIASLLVIAAGPAFGDPIMAKDAATHVGTTATVEGRVMVDRMPSGEIYLDLDVSDQKVPVSGYISRWNAVRFPDVDALNGKTIDITGAIGTFRKRPEIFLSDSSQIVAK